MLETLKNYNERLSQYQCCSSNPEHICNCVNELSMDYDLSIRNADTYDCPKKMDTYVIKYGVAYASEIYHYLIASDFKTQQLPALAGSC
ncbi:MAG: hypothetical protein WBI40_09110 [Methylococcaceae bacterium]